MRRPQGRSGAALILAAAALACKAGGSPPPPPPGLDEVRSFLSLAGRAVASQDESALRRLFEGGASYPQADYAFIRSLQFWKLRPATRVRRLGPDAFQINFLPEQEDAKDGVVTVRMRVTLPVRRGEDGQLRILTRSETERLAKLPVPEEPEGERVALDYPDEGGLSRRPGSHYATEFAATANGRRVRLALRFEPPLTGRGLVVDRPVRQDFAIGDEIRLAISIDADASAATGFRMDEFYRRVQEVDASGRAREIELWRGFGIDKQLVVEGRKFVESDGVRVWGLRAILRDVAKERVAARTFRDPGKAVLEKTLADPELEVQGEVLTLTVPAALLPMRAGARYRVLIETNNGYPRRPRAQGGKVGGG